MVEFTASPFENMKNLVITTAIVLTGGAKITYMTKDHVYQSKSLRLEIIEAWGRTQKGEELMRRAKNLSDEGWN